MSRHVCERCRSVEGFSSFLNKIEIGPTFKRVRWLCNDCYRFLCESIDQLLREEAFKDNEEESGE